MFVDSQSVINTSQFQHRWQWRRDTSDYKMSILKMLKLEKKCTLWMMKYGKWKDNLTFVNWTFLESEGFSVVSESLQPHGLYRPWNSPGQNTGVGSISLLQEIFPTQGSNPGLPHCRWILHQLGHKGSPRMLEWVAYPFSRGSSQPRNWSRVSCIAGRFFNNWAIRDIGI